MRTFEIRNARTGSSVMLRADDAEHALEISAEQSGADVREMKEAGFIVRETPVEHVARIHKTMKANRATPARRPIFVDRPPIPN